MKLAWIASLALVGGCMVPVGLNVQQVAVATLQPAESPAAPASTAAGGSPGTGAAGASPSAGDAPAPADNPDATAIKPQVTPDDELLLAVSPSTAKIAYASGDGIAVGEGELKPRKIAERHGRVRAMSWTPDGQALLLIEDETEDPQGKVRVERLTVADGLRRLLAAAVDGFVDAAISPAGHKAAFRASAGLTLVDLDLGITSKPLMDQPITGWAWSPTGDRLAYADGQLAPTVSVLPLAGLKPRAVGTIPDARSEGPFWNAAGTALRLIEHAPDGARFYSVPLDGGAVSSEPLPGGQLGACHGSPDGSGVLALRGSDLVSVDFEHRTVTPRVGSATFLQWIGNGPRFVCTQGSGSGIQFFEL